MSPELTTESNQSQGDPTFRRGIWVSLQHILAEIIVTISVNLRTGELKFSEEMSPFLYSHCPSCIKGSPTVVFAKWNERWSKTILSGRNRPGRNWP